FVNSEDFTLKLNGLLSIVSAFLFEIIIVNCQYWRLWEFNDQVVQFVSFGLWEAHYPQEFNVSGTVIKKLVHTPINSTWTISTELQFAESLIVCAILMKPVVLVFSTMAINISCMKNPVVEMQKSCYLVSAIVLFLSSLFTFVSVSWNHIVDHYGQTTFEFPPDFPVKEADLINRHYTAVFPLGVLTTIMSFIGMIIFLSETISLELQSHEKAKSDSIVADQE
ncbi:putative protein LOC100750885, partial [Sigmodon hispidus]